LNGVKNDASYPYGCSAEIQSMQVSLEGAIVATGNQRLLTAQVDGTVRVVEPDGERTLVVVAKNNNSIRMYLTEECVFQTMTFGATELVPHRRGLSHHILSSAQLVP
jgi:hypothetical protein